MFIQYKNPLSVVITACAGLALLAPINEVSAQDNGSIEREKEKSTETRSQDTGSTFRNKVRAAFDQDTPTIGETDVTEEFLTRTHGADNFNLDTTIPEQAFRDDGPRILLKKIRFHRLKEYPEYGIERETIEQLAEKLRVQFMKEDQLLASGYSTENLVELAALLESINAQANPSGIGVQQVEELVHVIEQQNAERGVSYADLEEIAAALTSYYRNQGLFLAQVQIPAQEVKDGEVTLTVQEGLLGQVAVEGNNKYSDEILASTFDDQLGKLVSHTKVEEGLYILNDFPSLNATGYFSAGDNPGETRLNIKVNDEQSWRSAVRIDNHGSAFTGDQRVYTTINWLNPTGIGDAIAVSYLKSSNVDQLDGDFGSDLGQLRYSLPVFGARTRLQFSADHNTFLIQDQKSPNSLFNALDIGGVNKSYALSLEHKFKRSRNLNISGTFGLTDKKAESDTNISALSGSRLQSNDHVYGGELGFYLDHLSRGTVPMLNIINANFQYGEYQNVNNAQRDLMEEDWFTKASINTSSLFFVPIPFSETSSRFIVKSRFQYSGQILPAFEQFSLGGANGVRGFDIRDFSADVTGLLSTEWYLNFPVILNPTIFGSQLNDIMQVAIIADAGYGKLNYQIKNEKTSWTSLSSAGLLFKLSWKEAFASQISVAWPTMSKGTVEGIGESSNSPVIYADFSFFFH
ncbi:MAG: ShlB/FhaC/HecB family hemolysin secretion/activation protein [Gammaproteobacteria bacterium]|nr:ShlB/FhaC/HecB family hemolysin secretion/activation protein [Gammaproteobacteria bacterium]